MAMFKGFKPQGLQKIASRMGYAGRMEEFDRYLEQNPDNNNTSVKLVADGITYSVPIDTANRHYQAILEWAKIDGNTIAEAD